MPNLFRYRFPIALIWVWLAIWPFDAFSNHLCTAEEHPMDRGRAWRWADSRGLDECSGPTGRQDTGVEVESFQIIEEVVQAELETVAPDRILIVLDIDNTLLAMNQSLGSDQWYEWQANLLEHEPGSSQLVASDLQGLLDVQGVLYALGSMHPPEDDLPEVIRRIQSTGCCVIVLTSRGDGFRNATIRELAANGYSFDSSQLRIVEPTRGAFLPFDPEAPQRSGLTVEEAAEINSPRPVSYANGVLMVAGQHKGLMLRTLLARSDRQFDSIVFVDDHLKHIDRMSAAFEDSGVQLRLFRYSREDENVRSFEASDKREVTRQWRRLRRTLDSILIN